MLGLMVSASPLAAALGHFVAGWASDRVGPRRLIPTGLAIYSVSAFLTPASTTAGPVVALRGVSGLGTGVYNVGERMYIRQVVDRTRLAFANSLVQASAAVGLVIGPLLGGAMAESSDLGFPFVVAGVACAVAFVISVFLPNRRHVNAAVGVSSAATQADVSTRSLATLLIANLGLAAGYGSFITTFAPFATDNLLWGTTETGLALSLFALGNVAGAPLLGAAADRYGRRLIGSASAIPIVAFAVALVLPTPSALLHVLALAAGAGVAGFTASWYALLGIATGGDRGGRAFGTVTAISSLGVIVGALAAGQLWETISIQVAMIVTILAMSIAGLGLALYPESRSRPPAAE
jgi:MFS family permease